ncbi:MAG: threonylcarbamoyl-AMP synthase [Gammaproteobacteria bacterium]|nr:threonylcarbamoyl-AMP synthase [Gammaproteobacteria bacterium]
MRAARILHSGGVIAYPTEAVYGLGCLPQDEAAIDRILRLKRRSPSKGFIVIAASMKQVRECAALPEGEIGALVRDSWPGPVTWILHARDHVSASITGGRSTIAIRMTAHPVARALCITTGCAIVSTSANLSGHEPIRHKARLRRQIGRAVDMIVPGDLGDRTKPTAIRDGSTGAVIRAD